MDDFRKRTLGRTGLKVGRLGVAASYGAPAQAFEEAFEKGCNYFYMGSGRHRGNMHQAIRNIIKKGQRDKLVIAIQTYARNGMLMEPFFKRTLKKLGIDYADVMILGWHNKQPWPKLVDRAVSMKERGLFRFFGMSGHNRKLFPELNATNVFDVFQIRYNAAHRGAEKETFPYLNEKNQPGIISYTATRWGHLLNDKKMPEGEKAPSSSDCYRFAMTNGSVDVCLCGPKTVSEMRDALPALDLGPLNGDEMARMKKIGDHVHRTAKGFF
ncbi:MAG: aldo/keto reductase [Proteobacteria bacterium]|nr:aldo/keto reductase [Pseudomonadota bacterium]